MTPPPRCQWFGPVLCLAAAIPLFGSCLGDAGIDPPDDGGSVDVGGTGGAVSIGTGGRTGTGGAVISGSGGANTGGANTGGVSGSGGANTGGANTGGVSGSGGANTGGANTGGRGTGGANAGGASTGGRGTGGANTGGTSTGGRGTGGANTGGTGTGGRGTGGANTGGTGTGGRAGTGGASSMAGKCPATLSCPNGITCGCYLVAGLGANKMALLNAGATQYMLASAMMETEMMDTNYPAGDNKTGDSYNAGTCKQNWGMAKVCHPAWSGQPASAYSMMAAMNSSRTLDVQVYNECRAYYGDRWWAGHRNGASGLNNPNTTDINNFKAAEDWTNNMLTGHTTDDVRFWVTIPPIIVN